MFGLVRYNPRRNDSMFEINIPRTQDSRESSFGVFATCNLYSKKKKRFEIQMTKTNLGANLKKCATTIVAFQVKPQLQYCMQLKLLHDSIGLCQLLYSSMSCLLGSERATRYSHQLYSLHSSASFFISLYALYNESYVSLAVR